MEKKLGERIRKLRKFLGLNQTELALKMGFQTAAAISKYEKNENEPNLDFLTKLSKMANINLEWLLTGEGPMMRTDSVCRPPPAMQPNTMPKDDIEEKILLMLKGMDEEKKRDVLKYIQEKKLLMELLEEREKAQRKIS